MMNTKLSALKVEKGLQKLIITMTVLGISLIVLWAFFYLITRNIVKKNAGIQAAAECEAIISRIDEKLVMIDETLYSLAFSDAIIEMASADTTLDFYDMEKDVSQKVYSIIDANSPTYDVIVYGANNCYYRLVGKNSNTVLDRVKNILDRGIRNNFYLSSNGVTYIGNAREIRRDDINCGYVVLLLNKSSLEYIFSDYSDIDYMGIVLKSEDDILCANRNVQIEDINRIKSECVIFKEQKIGLTGLTLLVYCENTISEELEGYFRIAHPTIALIIVLIIVFYIYYWNKTMLGPQERELYNSRMQAKDAELEKEKSLLSLLRKQISAHFTVNSLTAIRSLVNKNEKEEAARMCDELSCLLRYSNSLDEYISLLDECYVLNQYVGIMQARYPNRIQLVVEYDDFFENVLIPRMILQPVIENSIEHGLPGRDNITITISAKKEDKLIVLIRDNGQ